MAEEHNIPKTYDPASVEKKWYQFWEKNKYFHAEPDSDRKPFTIVIPPPNITGQLHMGHALDNTLQDILKIKVEEEIKKNEGLTRYDLGREEFVKRVWAWKEQYSNRIIDQLKCLGISCDWDRIRFTLDEGCSRAVREVFVSLYERTAIRR